MPRGLISWQAVIRRLGYATGYFCKKPLILSVFFTKEHPKPLRYQG